MDIELLQMAIKSLAADLAETKADLKAVRAELHNLRRRPIDPFGSPYDAESLPERVSEDG